MRPLLHRVPRPASLAILVGIAALLLVEAEAAAARRIVYLGFGGPKGADATRLVSRFLTGRFELIGRGRFAQEAQRRGVSPGSANGRSIAARALKAVAIVGGTVGRSGGLFSLRVTVYSASNGQPVGNLTYPLRGMRVDLLTARRVATGIIPAVARARPGAPVGTAVAAAAPRPARRPVAPRVAEQPVAVRTVPVAPRRPARPQPGFDDGTDGGDADEDDAGGGNNADPVQDEPAAQPPAREPRPAPPPPRVAQNEGHGDGENLGFDVPGEENDAEGDRDSPRRRSNGKAETGAQVSKRRTGRAEWEKIIEASVGLVLLNRSFDFNDPIEPRTPHNYRSGMVPALNADAAFHPFAFFGRNALGGLGLVGSYYRVPVLRSKVEGVETATTLHQLELGLRYRWNILGKPTSPTLRAGLSYGRLAFVIHYDPTIYGTTVKVPLPNIAYLYLKFALLHLEVPFYVKRSFAVGAMASFDYLHVFSAGEIESTDSSGYGDSTTGGIDFSGGAFVTVAGFFFRISGFYRRMFFTFDSQKCSPPDCTHSTAGGALDIYQGVSMMAGYAY